ncbi:MAG: PilZ domain-containing protein [Oligoflexia bacterium]|nr:PilZ domain-containing protein [Oligoflexia bacterium]
MSKWPKQEDSVDDNSFMSEEERQIEKVHAPIIPEPIYDERPFRAKLIVEVKSEIEKKEEEKTIALELPVWRISPLGIELALDAKSLPYRKFLTKGALVNLIVYPQEDECSFQGVIISSSVKVHDKEIIGIRWHAPSNQEQKSSMYLEKRHHHRWICPSEFLPTGIAHNPLKFNDYIRFQVRDLSLQGMQLTTSLRNRSLIPGMKLEAMFSFPLVGDLTIAFHINNVRITKLNNRNYLTLGVEVLNPDTAYKETIGQYVFQFGSGRTIEDLKKHGLIINSTSKSLDFSYVRSKEDYLDVLKLRRISYGASDSIPPELPIEDTSDLYDSRARIIMGKLHNELVATARILFHNENDELEHEKFITLPENFPRKDEIVEATRVCIHPEYNNNNDLFYLLIRQILMIALQSKRKYIISSTIPSLAKLYEKIGAQMLGVRFLHGDLGDIPHELILLDVQELISGENISPMLWNKLFNEFSDYLLKKNLLALTLKQKIRIHAYKTLTPILKIFKKEIK